MKKINVSPPRPGNLYPDLSDIHSEEPVRPETAMSEESSAPSEAPSLGTAIKRMASKRSIPMKSIAESTDDDNDQMEVSDCMDDNDINDMLDEALDDSQVMADHSGPTPPKLARNTSPSTSSAASWEFQTPGMNSAQTRDFKTPRVDNITDSPQASLPQVETETGGSSALMHTVSFYRKQKPIGNVTQLGKITRNTPIGKVICLQMFLSASSKVWRFYRPLFFLTI